MIAVDPEWWEHLTPAVMHRHRSAFDTVLNRFVSSRYGALWLDRALTPGGLIRVSPGQIIPVVHVVIFGDGGGVLLPQRRIRAGHRFVGPTEMGSGHALAPGELALGPEIRFELVTDPVMLTAVRTLNLDVSFLGVTRPSQIFSTPAHHLLRPAHRPAGTHVLYQHIFGHQTTYPDDGWFYVGITTRRWQTRWSEHRRAIESGSPLRFHQRYREEAAAGRISYVHHKVMGVTDNVESLYSAEKWLLKGHWQDERRLNMSSGGRAGRRARSSAARPAPAVALRKRKPRLDLNQLEAIRALKGLASPSEIARRVSGSPRQIRGVLTGRTYRGET
jgi:hypothetical protein